MGSQHSPTKGQELEAPDINHGDFSFPQDAVSPPTNLNNTAINLAGSMMDANTWNNLDLALQNDFGSRMWNLGQRFRGILPDSQQNVTSCDSDTHQTSGVTAATSHHEKSPIWTASSGIGSRRPSASPKSSEDSSISWPPQTFVPGPLPRPGVAVGDRLYLAHFTVNIAEILPSRLEPLFTIVKNITPLRYAAMALAAANLANQKGKPAADVNGNWIAMPSHANSALRFMMDSLAAMQVESALSMEACVIIEILNLCYHLEAGTMQDMQETLKHLDHTILSYSDNISSLACGKDIIRCWLHLRSVCALSRPPHEPYGLESSVESLVIELEGSIATSWEHIHIITAKAWQVCHRLLILKCMGTRGDSTKETLDKCIRWWDILKADDENCATSSWKDMAGTLSEEDLYTELGHLRSSLDDCEVPEEFPSRLEDTRSLPQTIQEIEPLRFSSHSSAMACADYAFSRLICEEDLVSTLLRDPVGTRPDQGCLLAKRTSRWLRLLFRIAMGLDPIDCAKRNMYRSGITSHLYYGTLFTLGNAELGLVDSFLHHLLNAGIFFESSFLPLRSFSSYIQALQREAEKGRTVFMGCLTYPAWTRREMLFSNGADEFLIIYGREVDGHYFNDLVPMFQDPGNAPAAMFERSCEIEATC
ncbi:hypothetical protein NM208_g15259 [Fusarium decemcellulare]|uniref:Uncharacterized protein n=1 Tax=Fusarium decemcellulare TaxID=57161 RepID=A0ACC1RG46_9HYPO|nr:hypothetical protein NM208_g15259 [Fusarium decemcellulare]